MKKNGILKYAAGISAALVMAAGLAGCAKKEAAGADGQKGVKIGISKFVAHPALDAVEQGVIDHLAAAGFNAEFDLQNANADVNTTAQIAAQFLNEKVSIAVGIATPAAIALANNLKEIPIVFSAITDPKGAGLVTTLDAGKNNVTGVSDAIVVLDHLKLFKEIAGIKTLGYIYTSSEDNSISSLADVRAACASEGIALVVEAISNSSELRQAAESVVGRVDGIYITNDNTVYAALPALIDVCRRTKKPLFSVDVTSCKDGGALIASGWDYYKMGLATGELVLDILRGKSPSEIPVRFMDIRSEASLLIDLDVAANCGITVPAETLAQAKMIFQNGVLTER